MAKNEAPPKPHAKAFNPKPYFINEFAIGKRKGPACNNFDTETQECNIVSRPKNSEPQVAIRRCKVVSMLSRGMRTPSR
jgi:hypothetical protein